MTTNHHQLSAIIFSDIVGYTALMGRDEDKGLELLKKNRQIQKPLIEKHHGVWIKEMGDGMMARFNSAYNAVKCAIEIQQIAKKEFPGQLRIGIHLGDIVIEDGDIFGDDVNIASRIESIADPGGIYISEPIQKALQNHADIQTKYIGPTDLKNVQEQVKIYFIAGQGLATPGRKKIKRLQQIRSDKFYKKVPFLFLLLILLILSVFSINFWIENRTERKVKSIAVIPFANLTGNENEQYFVDMMHDAVIGELSQIGNLQVKSRTSTLQFQDTKLTIPEIAKQLNVDAIIESSVYKTDDSVLLIVQLIQARPEENHIWSKTFERDTKHILSLYGELARTITRDIEVQLTPQEKIQLTHYEEVDPEVYKLYMQGQFHWKKLTKREMELSKDYFDMILEKDPDHALAHAGLSIFYVVYAQMGHISFFEGGPKAKYHVERALDLNNMLPEVHHAVAFNAWMHWDWEQCLPVYRKILKSNPTFALIHAHISELLTILQYPEEGIREAEIAIEMDPFNDSYKALYGKVLLFNKRYDEAVSVLKDALQESPDNPMLLSTLRSVYHQKRMYPEAIEMWKDSYRIKNDQEAVETLDIGYEKGGYSMALQRLAELLFKRLNSNPKYIPEWNIATLYTRAGKKEEALLWLEKAFDSHSVNMPYIRVDPIFDFMRYEPRFQALIKKMNFPAD